MIVPIEPGQGPRDNVPAGGRPEKGFRMIGSRMDAAARQHAIAQPCICTDRDPVEQDGPPDRSPGFHARAAQDTVGCLEPPRRLSDEDTQPIVEIPASFRKGSGARERFERRAEEIARAAEVGERLLMEDESDLLPPPLEQGPPQMFHEPRLPGRDAREEPGGQHADAGIEERAWAVDAEGRDSVPFGLKRRVPLRIPVFRDEQSRGASGVTVTAEKSREVRRDRGVCVDDQEVPARQKRAGVAQGAGGAENPGFLEKGELRKMRRLMAQVALDLVAQVMEINRHFADARFVKPPKMR